MNHSDRLNGLDKRAKAIGYFRPFDSLNWIEQVGARKSEQRLKSSSVKEEYKGQYDSGVVVEDVLTFLFSRKYQFFLPSEWTL